MLVVLLLVRSLPNGLRGAARPGSPISQDELQDEAMRVSNDEPMKRPKILFCGLTRPLMSSSLDLGRIRVFVEEESMG